MSCPLDYSLCDQTVTLYRLEKERIFRQVVEHAYYSWQIVQVTKEWGSSQETLFSLILPGAISIQPGDRVYDGVGPEISRQQWEEFLPVLVPGLAQVQYVKPCCFQGEICHMEAGRK